MLLSDKPDTVATPFLARTEPLAVPFYNEPELAPFKSFLFSSPRYELVDRATARELVRRKGPVTAEGSLALLTGLLPGNLDLSFNDAAAIQLRDRTFVTLLPSPEALMRITKEKEFAKTRLNIKKSIIVRSPIIAWLKDHEDAEIIADRTQQVIKRLGSVSIQYGPPVIRSF